MVLVLMSHCVGYRISFIKQLNKYVQVDNFRACIGNNAKSCPRFNKECDKIMRQYKFYLALVGRPKLRFKDNLKSLLKIGNLLDVWQEEALDRVRWRSRIMHVCAKLNEKRVRSYERRKEKRK